MTQVVCFGELLIDFVAMERGTSVGDVHTFTKVPGGAPANVAVGLCRLGISSALITQLGDDPFGHFLIQVLEQNQVNTSGIRLTSQAMTPLAFASITLEGERSFAFYRKPSADMLMQPDDLDVSLITHSKIFHYGSITLINEPVRTTTLAAISIAKAAGAWISYDANLRLPLWDSPEAAQVGLLLGLQHAQIVKLSIEELAFLLQDDRLIHAEDDIDALRTAVQSLWHDTLKLMVVTLGKSGAIAFTQKNHWRAQGFGVEVVDTIGAGDGFMAGLLAQLIQQGLTDDLTSILQYANAVGALTASKQGAIPALPDKTTVELFLEQRVSMALRKKTGE